MPKPGPRPYECARKAWHNDIHLHIRGSLIQEIFRLASEVHKPATKMNKEWEEKLPIVVLRAEEILYSKANCEAEYVDLSTLEDRVNDAIDTIIRRETESSEDGKLLQPCIEAALQLGCLPRTSSRSQRYKAPGCYLTSPTKDHPSLSTNPLSLPNRTSNLPFKPHQSNFVAVTSKDTSPSGSLQCLTVQPHSARNSYPIYPLHFEDPINPDNSSFYTKISTTLGSHRIVPKIMGDGKNGSNKRNVNETKCDLSLRLGNVVEPCTTSYGSSWSQDAEISGSISSQCQRRRLKLSIPQTGEQLLFLP